MMPMDDKGYLMADMESHYIDTWDAILEELFLMRKNCE
jgi:hypothetical protein